MYFIKNYCLIIFGFILLPSNIITAEFEMDYFFGETAMRSKNNACDGNEDLIHECRLICGTNNYDCLYNECVCLDENKEEHKRYKNLTPKKKRMHLIQNDFQRLLDKLKHFATDKEPVDEEPLVLEELEHPALRHHIAHFCPNLEVARTCIRSCMKVGKPAFCGKDHRCYCGHKYDIHTEDPEVDIDDIYAQFRDLYAKYFGPKSGESMYSKK